MQSTVSMYVVNQYTSCLLSATMYVYATLTASKINKQINTRGDRTAFFSCRNPLPRLIRVYAAGVFTASSF